MLFIVSMHRSGSSLLSGLLGEVGLGHGPASELIPASKDNEKGYWERSDVVDVNESLLTDGLFNSSLPDFRAPLKSSDEKLDKLRSIAQKLKSQKVQVVKDPRLCFTLPLWLSEFSDAKVVFLFRDPLQVAKSLHVRQRIPITLGLALWELSCLAGLRNLSGVPHKICAFDDLVANDQVSQGIATWYNESDEGESISKAIFDPSLVHNKQSALDSGFLTESQTRLFETLSSGSQKGADSSVANMVTTDLPETLIATLTAAVEFADLGFDPQHGRLRDKQTELKMEELESSLRFLKSQRVETNSYIGTLKSEKQVLSKRCGDTELKSRKLESELTKLGQKYSLCTTQLKDVNASLTQANLELRTTSEDLHNQEESVRTLTLSFKKLKDESFFFKQQYQKAKAKNKRLAFRLAVYLDNILTMPAIIPLLKAGSRVKQALIRGFFLFKQYGRIANQQGIKSATKKAKKYVFNKKFSENISKAAAKNQTKSEVRAGQLKKIINAADLKLDSIQASLLIGLFDLKYYINQSGIESDISEEEGFNHFLIKGIDQGLAPSPFFSLSYVSKELNVSCDEAFSAWLLRGVHAGVVPTPLFDSEVYSAHFKSISFQTPLHMFAHFMSTGLHQNISPTLLFEPQWYRNHHGLNDGDSPYLRHYLCDGYTKAWRPSKLFSAFSRAQCKELKVSPLEFVVDTVGWGQIKHNLSSNTRYLALIEQVARVEPNIHKPHGVRRINAPPYNTPIFPAVRELRASLSETNYDSIVLIPHCRVGGAALVAGYFCKALMTSRPDDRVLLVRTDNDDFMRPDWFPDQIEICNLLDFGPDLPDVFRKKLLLDLLVGTKPKRIVNIHSRLGWIVFSEFGDRLSSWSKLYGYTFCYDVDLLGRKVGYPVKFVPDAIKHLSYLFVDNQFLKTDLQEVNQWSKDIASKVAVLRSPLSDSHASVDTEWTPPALKEGEDRPQIYWAGRFDRQKRFDLVIKIAANNPQWDFHVWGKAMLSDGSEELDMPENISLHGLFNDFDEIDISKCSCWLYTSQWDGVPTMLLKLAARGMPVVGSQVWGISDVLTEKTGWPVTDISNVKKYEEGIKFFIENPNKAQMLGRDFRSHVVSKYNFNSYVAAVDKLVGSYK